METWKGLSRRQTWCSFHFSPCVCARAEGGRKEEDTDDLKWGFQQEGGGSVATPTLDTARELATGFPMWLS